MGVLIRVIVVSILLLALLLVLYSKSEKFSKAGKSAIAVLSALLLILAISYEITSSKRSEIDRALLDAFNQGSTLICEEREVTKDRFNFIGGTKVFAGKDGVKELYGVLLSIEKCGLK